MITQIVLSLYLIGVNWLSYSKQVPIKPFLNLPWLMPGWVPFLALIFEPLYQFKINLRSWIKNLIILLLIFGLLFGLKFEPTNNFSYGVVLAKTTSQITTFSKGEGFQGGMEMLIAYLGVIARGNDLLVYQLILSLVIWEFSREVNRIKQIKFKPLHGLIAVITGYFIASGAIQFNDVLPLLASLTFGLTLIRQWREHQNWIIEGLIWCAMLMINPLTNILLMTPIALILYPRQYILNWVVVLLINPLMIGGWL